MTRLAFRRSMCAPLLLLIVLFAQSANGKLPDHLQAYLEESSDELDSLYSDMIGDASQLLTMSTAERQQVGKLQALSWAQGRKTDPFLAVFADTLDPSNKKERREGPIWPVWVATIEASGNGGDKELYQVSSLRVAQAFAAAKGWRWRTHYLYPVNGTQGVVGMWGVTGLNIWAAIFKPEIGAEVWVGFELGAYFEKIIYEDSKRNEVSTLFSKYFNRCMNEKILACEVGLTVRQKDQGKLGLALKAAIRQSAYSSYAAKLTGNFFGGYYDLTPRFEVAEYYWLKAADLGEPTSIRDLGWLYADLGETGFKKYDPVKGEQYLQKANSAGDILAPRMLVELHKKVAKSDDVQDWNLMLAGATRGDAKALLWLAEKSFNQELQLKQACEWLQEAKKLDDDLVGSYALNKACAL